MALHGALGHGASRKRDVSYYVGELRSKWTHYSIGLEDIHASFRGQPGHLSRWFAWWDL